MSYLRFGTSEELLMQHIKEDPEAVKYAFSVIAKDAAELSRLLIEEAGCDGFTIVCRMQRSSAFPMRNTGIL